MVASVAQGREAEGRNRRDGRRHEDDERVDEQRDRSEDDLLLLDLLAQELGGAADHQPREEDGEDPVEHEVHEADALAAEDVVEHHLGERDEAAHGGQAVVHGVDRTGREGGGDRDEQGTHGLAEADLLAFHVAARLQQAGGLVQAQAREHGVARRLGPRHDGQEDEEHGAHGAEDDHGLLAVAEHLAEGDDQGHGQRHHEQKLQDVARRRRVLERVSRVLAVVATPVGAQVLDGIERGHGPARDRLGDTLGTDDLGRGCEGLGHPLEDQEKSANQREGQKDAAGDEDHVLVKVAHGVAADDAADEGDRHGEARGGAGEHGEGDGPHLAEVAEGGLTAVALPVGVGDEARSRVEGLQRLHASQLEGIEGQYPLREQDEEAKQRHEEVGHEHGHGVLPPIHAGRLAPDADQAQQGPLEGGEQPIEPSRLVIEDVGQVEAERIRDDQGREQDQDHLHEEGGCQLKPLLRLEAFGINHDVSQVDPDGHGEHQEHERAEHQ
ncbi:hypothetical protein D3C86_1112380 [compost metagenome]